jgi:hypothetical protein
MASSVRRVRFSSSPPIFGRMVLVPHLMGKGKACLGSTPLDVKTEESGRTGSNPERPPICLNRVSERPYKGEATRFEPDNDFMGRHVLR